MIWNNNIKEAYICSKWESKRGAATNEYRGWKGANRGRREGIEGEGATGARRERGQYEKLSYNAYII